MSERRFAGEKKSKIAPTCENFSPKKRNFWEVKKKCSNWVLKVNTIIDYVSLIRILWQIELRLSTIFHSDGFDCSKLQ